MPAKTKEVDFLEKTLICPKTSKRCICKITGSNLKQKTLQFSVSLFILHTQENSHLQVIDQMLSPSQSAGFFDYQYF